MLGWDVGYVWPLLEGVVSRPNQDADTCSEITMGNPDDTQSESSVSPSNQSPDVEAGPVPPPYDSTVTQTNPGPVTSTTSVPSQRTRAPSQRTRAVRTVVARSNRTNASVALRIRRQVFPHHASTVFAILNCVLGVSNVSRFSYLVYIYKGCFIFQFLMCSLVFGIPMVLLQMTLGQYLGRGMLDMWFISPLFKGLGLAMVYLYILLGVYNAIPLSWLFVYFKDSFITLKDKYKWGQCHDGFGEQMCRRALNNSASEFYGWTVPSYFHGLVLGRKAGEFQVGVLKFELSFNLCVVWVVIFACICRGPKFFGKIVYLLSIIPSALMIMVTMRLCQQWGNGIWEIVSASWKPVVFDSTAWWLAAREAFMMWVMLGAVILHLSSHNRLKCNIPRSICGIAITAFFVLICSAFVFGCAANVFQQKNFSLAYSSYEEESSVQTLRYGTWHRNNISITDMWTGISAIPKDSIKYHSGYQVLRMATEIFPAALAVEGVKNISAFWSICFYLSMILFGFGQQVVIWYCVVESIISVKYQVFKHWHITVTFFCCNMAFLLGLPMTSNMGIYIIYFLDFCVSSLWWIAMMYFILLFSVLFIRGRPYGTDQLVSVLARTPELRQKILPFFVLIWNVILPLSFVLMTISFLKTSSMDSSSFMSQFMDNYTYWPRWTKSLNLCAQMFPIILIVGVAVYQLARECLRKSDKPLIERLRQICIPDIQIPPFDQLSEVYTFQQTRRSNHATFLEDPPPKYTPPPSYSTATSRMLAKELANVFSPTSSSSRTGTLSNSERP